MQFKLTNMGRIGLADVTLNGITVIAGPNGSGKSTISRALFTWFNYLRNVEKVIPIERANSIWEDIKEVLIKGGMSTYLASRFMSTYFRGRQPMKFIDKSFWQDENVSRGWWVDRLTSSSWQRKPTDSDISWANQIYDQIRQCALIRLDMDEDELDRFILENYFLHAFDGQIGTYFDENATSDVALKNDDEVEQSCFFSCGKAKSVDRLMGANSNAYNGMQMFYLEPTHMLDDVPTELWKRGERRYKGMQYNNRYSANEDVLWSQILRKDLKRQDMTLPQAKRLEPIFKELDKIVSTIHGEISTDEQQLVFRDADLPGDKTISLMNIASGAKSMAAIVRGLRNDSIHPGDFIIIDEPESNLHPEWQVSFAKFLVLLHARFGIRVLLNTHSPYFLKAIEVYADAYEQGDDCSYYNMITKDGRQYNTDHVNDRIQDIFRTMSKPFSKLMHGEYYERTIP